MILNFLRFATRAWFLIVLDSKWSLWFIVNALITQLTVTCSKSTIETLKISVKYVQN